MQRAKIFNQDIMGGNNILPGTSEMVHLRTLRLAT